MRDIKFRAWEKELKEIIPINDISFGTEMVNVSGAWRQFSEIELMQFTGHNDIDEKEVFDGDLLVIIGAPEQRYAVRWSDIEGGWGLFYKDMHIFKIGMTHFMKVVGNVYEDSELLP